LISKSDVKYIQSLAHKKFREEEGVFVVEGVKMVEELITEFPELVVGIYGSPTWLETQLKDKELGCSIAMVDEKSLSRISQLKTPNEVLAVVKIPKKKIQLSSGNAITLLLDQIQDPGNLGTIIRTCDWFGIQEIYCSLDTVDAYNHKTVQSAKGSLLRVNIHYVNLVDHLKTLKDVPVYTAVLDGKSIYEVNFQLPAMLIIGNEANGVSPAVLAYTTQPITIPKIGKAESLNNLPEL
jgi:TrmH family RNA methyltransferase